MAILRVDGGAAVSADALAQAAAATAPDAPTVVMIHGFRYDPARADACPHSTLYRDGPTPAALNPRGRTASWPDGLGFAGACGGRALVVGYGWRARSAGLTRMLVEGRNGFAATYAAAADAGAALAPTLAALATARTAPIDLMTHSLGARVALAALRGLAQAGRADLLARVGRLILMGPAEFAAEARATLGALDRIGAPTPEVYCLLSRRNGPFDRLFEAFAPWGCGPSLGRAGLGARRARWLDVAFDDPRLIDWAAGRGLALAAPGAQPCHWSFYTRPGAMALHRAILDRAPGFGVEEMRAAGVPVHAPAARRRRWAERPGGDADPGLAATPA